MNKMTILSFEPLLKEIVWGGRGLERVGKNLPADTVIGESWELVDLPSDQSIETNSKMFLSELRSDHSSELLGGASLLEGRFPILAKFIDAQKTLSVQVHPDEAACARIGHGARPKTEAWYVMDCEPGAVLYVGLIPGVTKESFARAIKDGTVERLLHKLVVKPGDFVFLPAGTIHAIGEGIVLAEIQQSSNTTYRVFDWNRMDLDGNPRQLHVEQALESISFEQVGPPKAAPPPSGRPGLACEFFVMETVQQAQGQALLNGKGPLLLMGVSGDAQVKVKAEDQEANLELGKTLLVPASLADKVKLCFEGELAVLATRIPV